MSTLQPNPLPELGNDQPTTFMPQQRQKKGTSKLLMPMLFVLTALIFTVVGAGGYYLYDSQNSNIDSQNNDTENINIEEKTNQEGIEETSEEATPTEEFRVKSCNNTELGFMSSIPTDWTCETSSSTQLSNITNISGDTFTIIVSTDGRGPYCGDGPDPENLCTTKTYYESTSLIFASYYLEGELKEIFGGPKDSSPWISITYEDMESESLSFEQTVMLETFLDSVYVKI